MKTVQATTDLTAKQKIALLVEQHSVTYHQTELDELADTYSRGGYDRMFATREILDLLANMH